MAHRDAECKGAAARGPAGELRLRNVPREKIAAGVNQIRPATPLSPAIPRRRKRLSRPPVPCVREHQRLPQRGFERAHQQHLDTRTQEFALRFRAARVRLSTIFSGVRFRRFFHVAVGMVRGVCRRGAPRDAQTAAPATLGRYLTPLIRRRAVAMADPGTGDHPRRRWRGPAAASAMLRAPQEAPARSVRVVDRNQNPRCSMAWSSNARKCSQLTRSF